MTFLLQRDVAGRRVYFEGAGSKRMEDVTQILRDLGYGTAPLVALVHLWRCASPEFGITQCRMQI